MGGRGKLRFSPIEAAGVKSCLADLSFQVRPVLLSMKLPSCSSARALSSAPFGALRATSNFQRRDRRLASASTLARAQLAHRVAPAPVDGPLPSRLEIDRRRAVRVALGIPVRFGLFLVLPAGTLAWPKGWLFVCVALAEAAAQFIFVWRTNPEVVIARSHYRVDSKSWDKLLLCCYLPTTLSILTVAALDDGRFHWCSVPWAVSLCGLALFLFGFALITWAQSVNKFFESTVRIQSERGHRVIENGPYALVRHPGYFGSVLVCFGTALALGSLWALIPATIAAMLLVLRTRWEDQTLQGELAGYKDYTARVRNKLVPLLW
jgi:protein-S-isoprenylcysteine O-methyltransferase Ste14